MHDRRNFLRTAGLATLAGSALLEQSALLAARTRAAAIVEPTDDKLFDIEKVANGVYAALARPQLFINSNACIIVNEDDVVVVDTHSKPSAARALISQIKREITEKPVRYIVNTHFHWDHCLGTHAYVSSFPGPVHILSSAATRDLIIEEAQPRLKKTLAEIPKQIEDLNRRLEKATDPESRQTLQRMIAQAEAYREEMRSVEIDVPTMTFNNNLYLNKKGRDIDLSLQGLGHTSGDVVVHLPKERVLASGDLAHGFLPFIADGYPREWPATLKRVQSADFDHVVPGHGPVQKGKGTVSSFRNYLEDLTARVQLGMERGASIQDLQKEIVPTSLKSLRADGYLETLQKNYARFTASYPGAPPEFDTNFKGNIADVYKKLKVPKPAA